MKKLEERKSSTIATLWLGTSIIGSFVLGYAWGGLCNKKFEPKFNAALDRESKEAIDEMINNITEVAES